MTDEELNYTRAAGFFIQKFPRKVWRTRTVTSGVRGSTKYTVGPFIVTLQAESGSATDTYNELGKSIRAFYVLLGVGLPKTVKQTDTVTGITTDVTLFSNNDELVDEQGNRYFVVTPPIRFGDTTQVKVELRW